MFAYAGSASFPTYQADMKNKADFPKAVIFAMISKGTYKHKEQMLRYVFQFLSVSMFQWQQLVTTNLDYWPTMTEVLFLHSKIQDMSLKKHFSFSGIACVLCDSPIKLVVEILLLIHLISAYPMFLNPPNQFIENILGIEPTFNWKRVVFRSSVMLVLLFLAESLPSFSAILQLISSVFVTCLTFVFPPLFYMRLVDREAKKGGE